MPGNYAIGDPPLLIGTADSKKLSNISIPAGKRQIHEEKTHDAVLIIAFFVVQHSPVISMRQDNKFMRGRGRLEQF